MTERQIKSRFKRVIRNGRFKRWRFDSKKNKLVKDENTCIFYGCECGCKTYGNYDLWLVNGVPMSLDCAVKVLS